MARSTATSAPQASQPPRSAASIAVTSPSPAAFGVVVADPPYATGEGEVTAMLAALRGGWLASGAFVAVERATRSGPVAWPEGYAPDGSRHYGEATFWYGLAAGI